MPQESNSYAETAVTIFALAALALGTLAMIVRAILRHRHTLKSAGRQMVADVRKGEGWTFQQELFDRAKHTPLQQLNLRQWLDLVNHRPDQVPHLFVEGGSGAGKTTLTTAILQDRTDLVAVVGVKPDDGWGEGYVYRSAERATYLGQLLTEVRRRLDENDRSGITIVLDDFTRLTQHKEAVELYKEIADIGRSLRIRLILVARGRQVKGIGAQGESDLLDHFAFLSVSRGSHAVTLEIEEEVTQIDTKQVRELAQPLNGGRWWKLREVKSVLEAEDSVLVRLLQGTSAGETNRTGTHGTSGIPHSEAVLLHDDNVTNTEGVPGRLTSEAIQTLYNSGWSKNRIAALLIGSKSKRLAIIDAALTETEASHVA